MIKRPATQFSKLSGLLLERSPWQVPFWAAVYLAVAAILQFHFVSVPYDADTAYHVAVGRLIRTTVSFMLFRGPLSAGWQIIMPTRSFSYTCSSFPSPESTG